MNPNTNPEQNPVANPNVNQTPSPNLVIGSQASPQPTVPLEPQVVPQSTIQTPQNYPDPNAAPVQSATKSKKKLILIILATVLLIAIGLAAYLWVTQANKTAVESTVSEAAPVAVEVSTAPAVLEGNKVVTDCYSFDLPENFTIEEGSSACGLNLVIPSPSMTITLGASNLAGVSDMVDAMGKLYDISDTTNYQVNGYNITKMLGTSKKSGVEISVRIISDESGKHLKSSKPVTGYLILGGDYIKASVLDSIVDSFKIK